MNALNKSLKPTDFGVGLAPRYAHRCRSKRMAFDTASIVVEAQSENVPVPVEMPTGCSTKRRQHLELSLSNHFKESKKCPV